jgi:hypothetical protein
MSTKDKTKKQKLGQFYTTNYTYILDGINIPNDVKNIVEPFAGNKDLVKFIKNPEKFIIECYDIDPKTTDTFQRDTLLNPIDLNNKFVITNPPYLARNKSSNKEIFDKYDVNDLYKCFIMQIINSDNNIGGILIIPLNFWCSIRKADVELRKKFLSKYNIKRLNIFEENVFNDTSYTVCSFQYEKKINNILIDTYIYPSKNNISLDLNNDNMYTIGGEIYKLKQTNKYTITRLTSENKSKNSTNILVKCIDDNKNNMINLSYVSDDDKYIDETEKLSARTYATLLITPEIDHATQLTLIDNFNTFLNKHREKYNSLFLANYRESKDIARKRISFDLVYSITNHLLYMMKI